MQQQQLFVIGQVWPEPGSSAAGWRILQLIRLFANQGYVIHFGSAAVPSAYAYALGQMGVKPHALALNDSSFDALMADIQPDIVLFDRYMAEEQFGWRVAQACPQALRILDTEDLHFLRLSRQEAYVQGRLWTSDDLYTATAMRELAAIYRSDLSIIISRKEYDLLRDEFGVLPRQLCYLPFFGEALPRVQDSGWRPYASREHLVFMGNFLHQPNWHTVLLLKELYWPLIHRQLPGVEVHVYGAYASQKVQALHCPKDGFHIMGRAEDARATIQQYRLLVAPIPFGAGMKGKFVDAMMTGTPAISSAVGAEGMDGNGWAGAIADAADTFVAQTVHLYLHEEDWTRQQQRIPAVMAGWMADADRQQRFINTINSLSKDLAKHRRRNIIGRMLEREQLASTKYMSRWIEAKNALSK